MLRVCGTGRVRIGDPFPCSTVFLADERQAAALSEPRLRERIAAALGSSARAVAWVGGDGALTVLPYDEQARVTRRVELATGLTIEPGSIVEAGDPRLTIHGAGDQPDVTVGIEGESAGALGYRSTAGVDAWIRYFHPRTGAIDALRFRLFPLAETRVDVRFDPANPHGPARSRATPASATTRASTFRTRWGAAVELTALPPHSSYVWAYDPASGESYMTLDGAWGWSVAGAGSSTRSSSCRAAPARSTSRAPRRSSSASWRGLPRSRPTSTRPSPCGRRRTRRSRSPRARPASGSP